MWIDLKFESTLTKQDEGLYLQNKVNCEETMKMIELVYGPFSEDEINFYIKKLSKDGKFTINQFQETLVFNLFYKYFFAIHYVYTTRQKPQFRLVFALHNICAIYIIYIIIIRWVDFNIFNIRLRVNENRVRSQSPSVRQSNKTENQTLFFY